MRRVSATTGLALVVPLAFLLVTHEKQARGDARAVGDAGVEQTEAVTLPSLAEFIPQAAGLTGRLGALENRIKRGFDPAEIGRKVEAIEADLSTLAGRLERTKKAEDYRYGDLVEIGELIRREDQLIEVLSKRLREEVRELETTRSKWLEEEKLWNDRQSSLHERNEFEQLQPIFAKATQDIEKAFGLIAARLAKVLEVQRGTGTVQARIDTLDAFLEGLLDEKRRSAFADASPPMFSSQYVAQLKSGLWNATREQRNVLAWPGQEFLHRQGWVVLAQVALFLLVLIAVFKRRDVLRNSQRWQFVAARPFAAALFLSYMGTVVAYEYAGAPAMWKLATTIIAACSFCRLAGVLLGPLWRKQFVYGLMSVLVITGVLEILNLSLPLVRLYTVVAALVSLLACLYLKRESSRQPEAIGYAWILRLGSGALAVIIIAEIWGKSALGQYLFLSLVNATATVLVFLLLMHMVHGLLEWAFYASPLARAAGLRRVDADRIIDRVVRLVDGAIWGLVLLPAILMIFGYRDTLGDATRDFLAIGFSLGSQRISVGLVLAAAGIVYGSFLLSWLLQELLLDEALVRRRMERGVRHAIGRLVHYAIITVAFLIALATLGFEITKLTIALSALGIGIGFGLQNIVNNFVSGIILLFERPVRVGDTIEINGNWAEIKYIGLRATTVQTFDQADVIIPNADLVSNQVTNWTLSNRQVRLTICVGVAYGSNVALVMKTLVQCAKEHERVSVSPAPQVLFLSFGESSLDFELRVWVADADYRMVVRSDLHQAIDQRFRDASIEIAFPQRDLHLRTVDESVTVPPMQRPQGG